MGLRIAAVFIILVASLLGVFLPMLLTRIPTKWRYTKLALFICKYFGSGIIMSTAFVHLLSPAVEALSDECLSAYLPEYDWGISICMMTIMVMFAIELLAARFHFGFGHAHGSLQPTPSVAMTASDQNKYSDTSYSGLSQRSNSSSTVSGTKAGGRSAALSLDVEAGQVVRNPCCNDNCEPVKVVSFTRPQTQGSAGEEQAVAPCCEDPNSNYAGQIVTLMVLEFGIVFHSLFIGMSLAGSDELRILLIVISFHQFFEGLGLGSRLAVAEWPSSWKSLTGVFMALGYAVTTPAGVAIGLGVNRSLASDPTMSQLVNGIFDAISAGILIYTAMVELLAHEFMFNPEMRNAKFSVELTAYACVAAGVAVMSVLAKWA